MIKREDKYRRKIFSGTLILFLVGFGLTNAQIIKPDSLIPNFKLKMQSYVVHDPININHDNELAVIASSGTGTVDDPFIIAGWNISNAQEYGIVISGTTKHFIVENCWINSSKNHRIFVDDVTTGTSTIINNTCTNNDKSGIRFWASSSSTLANNTCTGNGENGISIGGSGDSTIANNTCTNNVTVGISMGMALGPSEYNFLVWNRLVGNGDYGLYSSMGSDNNSIHHNSFIANGKHNSQAYDDGLNNQWYDEIVLEGNYWSDYSGNGNYVIEGSAGASDPFPMLAPSTYSKETDPIDLSLLMRIGLFLSIIGLFTLLFIRNRRSF